jgi:hypothetical protein
MALLPESSTTFSLTPTKGVAVGVAVADWIKPKTRIKNENNFFMNPP